MLLGQLWSALFSCHVMATVFSPALAHVLRTGHVSVSAVVLGLLCEARSCAATFAEACVLLRL
jgi:hypothetical protein